MTALAAANCQLPTGWRSLALGHVGSWFGGGTPSKANAQYWKDGTIPWVSPKDMKRQRISGAEDSITAAALKASPARLIPPGSVLVVTRSGILERTLPVAVTSCPVAINQDIKALVPDTGVVTADYVYYALRWAEKHILSRCSKSGTTVASISFNLLAGYFIPVPPLDVQRRIVDVIEEQFSRLDFADAALERAARNLRRLSAASIEQALSGSWTTVKLGDVITSLKNGIFVSRPAKDPPGIPILRISALRPMRLDVDDVRYAAIDDKSASPFFIESGDLLFTRYSGNRYYVGSCAVVPRLNRPTLHPDKLIRVAVDRSLALPEFLALTLNSGDSRCQIEDRLKTTAGQVGIAGSQLRSVSLRLPSMEIQNRIVNEVSRRLSLCDAELKQIVATSARSAALRRSILGAAFGQNMGYHFPMINADAAHSDDGWPRSNSTLTLSGGGESQS